MKRRASIILIAIAIGITAFAITQHLCGARCPDETTWLRKEFHLTDSQIAAIQKLRDDYRPTCAIHCEKLSRLRSQLDQLTTSGHRDSTEFQQAQAEWETISHECTTATRRHMEQIAALMPPEQAQRYLELVSPKLTQHDHAAPLGLK